MLQQFVPLFSKTVRYFLALVLLISSVAYAAQVDIRWFGHPEADNRRCSIDIQMSQSDSWIGCIVSSSVGMGKTHYQYNGFCDRDDKNYDLSKIDAFRINCALNGDFKSKNITHAEKKYNFTNEINLYYPGTAPSHVLLKWEGYQDERKCSVDVKIEGELLGCVTSSQINSKEYLWLNRNWC